jgi:hypothetical protein
MRKTLTKIEILDQQFPGLADQLRQWFCQGVSAEKIAARMFERYQLSVSPTTVGSFRSRRWVREQQLLQKRKIEILAAAEVAREQAIRASLAAKTPGDVQ